MKQIERVYNELLYRALEKNNRISTQSELSKKLNIPMVLLLNDLVAMGAYKALEELGIAIPGDVALVGFGNCVETSLFSISITTVDQPAYQIGMEAMQLLIEKLSKSKTNAEFLMSMNQ